MTNQIPEQFKYLFWDVNIKDIHTREHSRFIIERVLEKGDTDSLKWIKNNYGFDTINGVITNPINLSDQTVDFWQTFFTYAIDHIDTTS